MPAVIPASTEILTDAVIVWDTYRATRDALGAGFMRELSYFREGGLASVEAMERAMRDASAVDLIDPADRLADQARMFGADQLADACEAIAVFGLQCVEHHDTPEEYLPNVVAVRPLFLQSLAALEAESNPLAQRRAHHRGYDPWPGSAALKPR